MRLKIKDPTYEVDYQALIEGTIEFPNRPDLEYLTAALSCLGATISIEDLKFAQQFQNPYQQKRGGLGLAIFAVLSQKREISQKGESRFTSINVFSTKQAAISPYQLQILDDKGSFKLIEMSDSGQQVVAIGRLLSMPEWGNRTLSTGRPILEVIQQHGAVNLVSIIGSNRCKLFDQGNPCAFCMYDGGKNNLYREVEEIIEAFRIAAQYRRAYRLTVTTGLLDSSEIPELAIKITRLKAGMGDSPLALEINPFSEDIEELLKLLKKAGVDTLMLPMDCYSSEARRRFLPGKAGVLDEYYWKTARAAVGIFGSGNVTSNLIIGLEPFSESERAIQEMIRAGIVPEAIPVRWDDSRLERGKTYPLTNPNDLIQARQLISTGIRREEIRGELFQSKTLAGCAACGGCGGLASPSGKFVQNLQPEPDLVWIT